MPFDTRCPSCSAKLRLDEAPKPKSIIECPKCGNKFPAPARAGGKPEEPKAAAPKAAGEDTKRATGVKVQSKQRVHMNEFKLLGIVGGVMLVFILVLAGILWYLGKAARVQDMLAMLPKDANAIRGVNYAQLKKYPGYKSILTKHYAGNVKDAFEQIDKAAAGGGADEWLNYFLLARESSANGEGLSLLFNVKKKFDPSSVAAALNANTLTQGSETYYRMPAHTNPLLNYAVLYCPTDTNLLIIPEAQAAFAKPNQKPFAATLARLDKAIGYKTEKADDRIPGGMGTAGQLATRGHSWEIILPTGSMKDAAQGLGLLARNGMPKQNEPKQPAPSDANAAAGAAGWWVTVGGRGVRLGFAIEMGSSETASAAVKKYQEGPLGKGDESEVPNGMKQLIPESGQNEFKEFLQNLSYKSKGAAAYITSKMETGPEKAQGLVALFTKTFGLNPFTGSGGPGR